MGERSRMEKGIMGVEAADWMNAARTRLFKRFAGAGDGRFATQGVAWEALGEMG
jgi:hypothetical protein